MLYTAEQLDRSTGDLRIVDLGNWITVTEFGQQYGLGPKKIRSALHHLGMLQVEGKRLRLTSKAVALGYGRRHDFPKKHRHPFDVISPLGQKVIAENWERLIADMAEEKAGKPILKEASAALESFKKGRLGEVTTQMQVCWLRDHFHILTQEEIAALIDTPRPLVNRYVKLQEKQREYAKRQRQGEPQGATIAAATRVAA
ncbi:hypothetical protein ACD578_08950 [Microvirga sp. RSM25]|uniref:hypothetical protein n=1 Tax=Microvirga sp. RSM25 TaxID=3273802 RepID=UPI00384B5B72